MSLILKRDVRNWCHNDATLSMELINSFVQGVEKQASESIAHYRAERYREGHQGLDRDTWHLDGIFEQYFPSLLRRSALLTLWGYLEYELEKLCLLFQIEKGFKLAASDLSGRGIDRSTNYLEKVAGLDGLKNSAHFQHLKTLQRVRNLIAHGDGKLRDRNGKPREGVESLKTIAFLTGDDEIQLEEGFLSNVVGACVSYLDLIRSVIQAKTSSVTQTDKGSDCK